MDPSGIKLNGFEIKCICFSKSELFRLLNFGAQTQHELIAKSMTLHSCRFLDAAEHQERSNASQERLQALREAPKAPPGLIVNLAGRVG